MVPKITMLELIEIVTEITESENEILATVVHMVNSGMVELCGNFRGAKLVL